MSGKNTFEDIARIAGVGIATVDRVLNERGGVSEKTAEKVLQAARQLKSKRILPTSHHKMLRIEILLARPELPLIERINREFGRQAERIDKSVVIQRTTMKSDNPKVVARAIRETTCNAVVIFTQAHPLIHDAIEQASQRGVAVITIFSDLPDSRRLAYAGTDHYSAGRTAGYFMARMVRERGPIVVLCYHFGFLGHKQRVNGFRDALALYAPKLEISDIIEGGDNSATSERLLVKCFRSHHNVAGLYNVGAPNDACGAALRRGQFKTKPIFVGYELTDHSRAMLLDGTMDLVIDQNPEHQAHFALDVVMHHFGYTEPGWLEVPYRSNYSFRLYTPENIMNSTTAID